MQASSIMQLMGSMGCMEEDIVVDKVLGMEVGKVRSSQACSVVGKDRSSCGHCSSLIKAQQLQIAQPLKQKVCFS